ncbi:MAG: ABC transporter [Bacteroidetes bacterium CG23_combo_of_CG06-09_8_20_14_all_32_9]|nr:MAG: ABC transporter [Bacteroidetes bacterium CG23_combo_of_CG06-09_8_20_14_all_32_9]
MSETILKALMRLFAIIADVEIGENGEISNPGRVVVASYLKQQLNQELVDEYLALFDEYIAQHHSKKGKKRLSANSVKVLAICSRVNDELRQEQKMLVLLKLFEFINYNNKVTGDEFEFVKTVADTFNIDKLEFDNCKALVLDKPDKIPHKQHLLLIDNDKDFSNTEVKHIYNEHVTGQLVILHIESTNMYAFGYIGNETFYLNSQVIYPKRVYVLVKGSSIRSRKTSPIYYSDIVGAFLSQLKSEKITFTAKNVEFKFNNSDNGLHLFNFSEETGQLIGVMGGSGAGKSTLLNILNGNIKPQKGEILINGHNIYTEKEAIKGVVGFVPQDDLLIEELTVYQNLYYNSKLCFSEYTEKQIDEAVTKVLQDLDLYEIRNLKVGGPLNKFISGGQRKRLNIALELIREPDIMFVDEPTSGLSSMDSEMVMDLLKEITLKGKLAIINIHQPSSDIFKLFDKILILDKGGYPIYFGNPTESVVYFKKATNHINANESECTTCGNVNPEQVLQIVESKVVDEYGKLTKNRKTSVKEWNKYYTDNIDVNFKEKTFSKKIPKNNFKIPSKIKQFRIFTVRDVLSKLTNKQYLLINFLEAPLLAFILGYFTKYIAGDVYLFSENENLHAYLFMAIVVSLFLGLTVSAEEIIRDRKILQREHFLSLSRFSYINSKVMIMFVLSAIQMLSFVLVGNYILGIKGLNINYFIILYSSSCFANMLGLNISSALNSVVTIYILIPFILVPQLLLSGVIVKFDKLHKTFASYKFVPVVGDIMTSRWAFEALAVTQFKDNKWEKNFFEIERKKSYAEFRFNYLIPELLNKLDGCERYLTKPTSQVNMEKNLLILYNEIELLEKSFSKKTFKELNKLNKKLFNADVVKYTRNYLESKKKYFLKKYNEETNNSDKKFSELSMKYPNKEDIIKIKEDYFNNSLSDLVTNKNSFQTIYEDDERYIQMTKPIFKEPESNYGRAHFYAPYKNLFGKKIDTLWFNTGFIWFTTIFMYIALIFEWLKKLINIGDKVNFGRKKDLD